MTVLGIFLISSVVAFIVFLLAGMAGMAIFGEWHDATSHGAGVFIGLAIIFGMLITVIIGVALGLLYILYMGIRHLCENVPGDPEKKPLSA